jgi:hypothetical protein
VRLAFDFLTWAGVPAATISPPWRPAPGPSAASASMAAKPDRVASCISVLIEARSGS